MKKFQKIMKDFNVHRVLCLIAFLLCLAGAAKAGQASAAESDAANLVLEEPRLKGASSVSSCKNCVLLL